MQRNHIKPYRNVIITTRVTGLSRVAVLRDHTFSYFDTIPACDRWRDIRTDDDS